MKALVTGGTGFLGRKLAERLAGMGFSVTATGRNRAIGEALEAQGIHFQALELADEPGMTAAIRGQDYVFHSGALSSPWGPYQAFHEANVIGTRNVARACLTHGVKRLIHVSTPSLYFDFRDRERIREDEPLPPKGVNAYAETKRLAETEVDWAASQGVETITIRPRALFGPGDTTILPRLIRANRGGRMPLFEGGRARIDITYVENVVDALILCQQAPASALGRQYNITNGEPMAVGEMLERLFARLDMPYEPRPLSFETGMRIAGVLEWVANTFQGGKEPVLNRYSVGLLARTQTLDITAAREQLGYVPRVSIDEGLEHFVAWWNARGSNGREQADGR